MRSYLFNAQGYLHCSQVGLLPTARTAMIRPATAEVHPPVRLRTPQPASNPLMSFLEGAQPIHPPVHPPATNKNPAPTKCQYGTMLWDAGAEDGIRTRTGLPPTVFKTVASAVPPLRHCA